MDKAVHPSIAHFEPLFRFHHLPAHLQAVSRPFGELAKQIAANLEGPEAAACLRKLLEAKDCAVRAIVLGQGDADAFGGKAGA